VPSPAPLENLRPPTSELDLSEKLRAAIDEAIIDLLGRGVLEALHEHLRDEYSVSPEEIPHRLDTLSESLELVFGEVAKTIEWAIARDFYVKTGLEFVENKEYGLRDYVELAKKSTM